MDNFRRLWCFIAIVGVLGAPAAAHAEPIAASVSKLSKADVHQVLNRAASHQKWNPYPRAIQTNAARRVVKGAAIGFFAGLVTGAMVKQDACGGGGSCGEIVLKSAFAGAVIGAVVGAAKR